MGNHYSSFLSRSFLSVLFTLCSWMLLLFVPIVSKERLFPFSWWSVVSFSKNKTKEEKNSKWNNSIKDKAASSEKEPLGTTRFLKWLLANRIYVQSSKEREREREIVTTSAKFLWSEVSRLLDNSFRTRNKTIRIRWLKRTSADWSCCINTGKRSGLCYS